VLSLLSPNQGKLTASLADLLWRMFGWGGVVMPLVTGAFGIYLVLWGMEQAPDPPAYRVWGFGLLFVSLESLASMMQERLDNGLFDVWQVAEAQSGGGYFGGAFAYVLTQFIGSLGAVFTLVLVGLVATVMVSGLSRADMGHFLRSLADKWAARRSSAAKRPGRRIKINPGRSPAQSDRQTEPVQPQLLTQPDEQATAEPKPKRTRGRAKGSRRPVRASKDEAPTIPSPVFLGNTSRGGVRSWTLPALAEVLESGSDQDMNNTAIREQVEIIEHTLDSFGAPATVVEINQGPAITQFGVEPNFIELRSGKRTKVKVGKIASLADDLALALAAQSIRIQAPVPGKGYVGIEVPNVSKTVVSLRDVIESSHYQKIKSHLRIGLGQNVAGQAIAADLAAMPHLLIAGTTGSGKSVCVNSIIASLLLQNTPDELKLVMVDPKRVELTGYNGIPHLAAPVVVEMDRVIGTLQWAMREMEHRYKLFADIGARNIGEYNKKVRRRPDAEKLSYIVIVIDELADLMMLSPEETERGVTRLAQMARATGIHMVIATQRPSVDVVTGLIKANFPARIAFAVASGTDSRVILDTTGAERLLGQGDMLFQSPDAAAPVRLQGCWVSDKELADLIEYWKKARRFSVVTAETSVMPRAEVAADTESSVDGRNAGSATAAPKRAASRRSASQEEIAQPDGATIRPEVEPDIVPDEAETQPSPQVQPLWEELQKAEAEAKHEDELMPEAIALVRKLEKASTSLLQRRFRIGYTRAARLIDIMEEDGIIGPPTGTSKAREVLPWQEVEPPSEPGAEEVQDGDESVVLAEDAS
jgi:S-DNA-T family DNA segregation ATPase FtsK/SpoIIIE